MPWMYDFECGPKCQSRRHAHELNAAITKTSLEGVQAYSTLCHQGALLADPVGRSALHVAASCGKNKVVEWLLSEKQIDINYRDAESGWTALHRALFYGQLSTARLLIKLNANLLVFDHEGLCPLDLIALDRPKSVTFSSKEPSEVYSWGQNSNFNLGHGKERQCLIPEAIDTFSRAKITIKQVALSGYHTVFLSARGQVYTCGHGQGGRLGHGDEATCLTPRLVESLGPGICVQVAAALDHTLFLMEGGTVFGCGMNNYHQLGPHPRTEKFLKPSEISTKSVKTPIIGMSCGRYHTVVYTQLAIYACGLNLGQIGFSKGATYQPQLRQVSWLNISGVSINQVSCSNAATAVHTCYGVYLLHDHYCRRIAPRLETVTKMLVAGGALPHVPDVDLSHERYQTELTVLLLFKSGQVMVWQECSCNLRSCLWLMRRHLQATDIALCTSCMAFTTPQGEAFLGFIPTEGRSLVDKLPPFNQRKNGFRSERLSDQELETDLQYVHVQPLPNVHRATAISSDINGFNYAIVQALPNGCLSELPSVDAPEIRSHFKMLLAEADVTDNIHDVVVEVGNRQWAAHRYVLTMRSDYFRRRLLGGMESEEDSVCLLNVPDVHPRLMEQVLTFIYTDTCELLTPGTKWAFLDNSVSTEGMLGCDIVDKEQRSAYQAVQALRNKKTAPGPDRRSPIKCLQDTARTLGVKGLAKRLEAVKYVNGVVEKTGKYLARPKVVFDRMKLPEFYDVCIQSSDGETVKCHKCVLVARLEYFHNMLSSDWLETTDTTALSLSAPVDILTLLLDFLYTDEASSLRECEDTELLCNMLVVADQLLVTRLKNICETSLANLLCLKNAAELLEFASVYNATQLHATCQEFITLNLAAILESRYLDVVSEETMDELSTYYRSKIPSRSWRIITPSSEGPSSDYLEQLARDFATYGGPASQATQPRKSKSRKKRSQTKNEDGAHRACASSPRQAESPRQRQVSVCSELSVASEEEKTESQELLQEEDVSKTSAAVPESSLPRAASAAVPIPPRPKDQPLGQRGSSLGLGLPSPPAQRDSVWGVSGPSSPRSPPTPSTPLTPASPTSPVPSAGSEPSLREMLRQDDEERARNKSGKSGAQQASRFSWKGVKKQQQEQQRQEQQQLLQQEREQWQRQQPSKLMCPWADSSPVVQSFRDLQQEEQRSACQPPTPGPPRDNLAAPPTPSGATPLLSWVRPRKTSETKSETTPSPSSSAPPNPWQGSLAASPPSPFSDIVRDEMEKTESLDKNSRKPLSLIQMEERAIQELLVHYREAEAEERISVERVPQAVAMPVWKRHSQPAAPRPIKSVSSCSSLHS